MSGWRVNQKPPADYHDLFEGSSDDEEGSNYEEMSADESAYEDEACDSFLEDPPYFPPMSPEPCEMSPRKDQQAPPGALSPDRSRSPMELFCSSESASLPTNVVLRIYDENGVPLEADDDSSFLAPDTHNLYVSAEERDRDRRNRSKTTGRRGVRSVRGRGARGMQSARESGSPNRGSRGGHKGGVRKPLNEIRTNDNDVPPELVSLAMDVMKKRQRLQDAASAERNAEREDASEIENEDEFLDASDGADAVCELESQNLHFEWSSMETFQGQEENFRPERSGSVHIHNSAYDAFRSYWNDDVLGLIVAETNLYATKITSESFQSEWCPTNIDEILCLFSFWMMLGIVRMPNITSCFSIDPLLKTEVYRRVFTRKRYEALIKALSFEDSDPALNKRNPSNTSARSFDQLHRFRPIIDHLNSSFQSNYILSKDIYIDESLILSKGRLDFKQYVRNKAANLGIKTFELCESTTGYLWSFIVYSGKQSPTDLEQTSSVPKSIAFVKNLIGPLLNKGYRLFMDSYYNSPLIARFLKLNGTDFVGTLSPSCRDVPILIKDAPLQRGEYIARHSGDVSVLSWQNSKRVTMISTCHDSSVALPTVSSTLTSRPVPFKPQVVLDYYKFKGGVDIKDIMLDPYLIERKRCVKWYLRLLKRLINISILNSRILLESSTQKHHNHLSFRLQLVDSILTNHLAQCPGRRKRETGTRDKPPPDSDRYIHSKHWPVLLKPTNLCVEQSRNFSKRCVVCVSKGRTTIKSTFCCESCRVPLCIKGGCFKSYHTPPPT